AENGQIPRDSYILDFADERCKASPDKRLDDYSMDSELAFVRKAAFSVNEALEYLVSDFPAMELFPYKGAAEKEKVAKATAAAAGYRAAAIAAFNGVPRTTVPVKDRDGTIQTKVVPPSDSDRGVAFFKAAEEAEKAERAWQEQVKKDLGLIQKDAEAATSAPDALALG
ncbi:MAG: hypothetical protein ACP5RC_07170, partial [Halothiobacillaceae bacterium]